jgi:hypothetical protein
MKFKRIRDSRYFKESESRDILGTFTAVAYINLVRVDHSVTYFLYCGYDYFERLPDARFPDFALALEAEVIDGTIPKHWICRSFRLDEKTVCLVMACAELCEPYIMEKLTNDDAEACSALVQELTRLGITASP